MTDTPRYDALEARFERIATLGEALGILHWDMSAMMPPGGAPARAGQIALLRQISHEMLTAPDTADLLAAAEAEPLDLWQRANLTEMRRDWIHADAVPADLVGALAHAESACEMVWREARAQADFPAVLPALGTLLGLVREAGAAKAARLGVGLYDALLDQYEPGGRIERILPLFEHLEGFLPGFIAQAIEAQARRPAPPAAEGPFPVEAQRRLGLRMMEVLGFDFDHGRLDVSHHPFCGGSPDDTRITTRYDESDFLSALMGVLHETGHALYEFGLPDGRWRRQPVGRARGMVLHESQSLLIEMQACRTAEFWSFAAPVVRETFGGHGPAWQAEALRARACRVHPGFIRVEADEVTYPAHVIIRTRLEQALIEGRMDLADLPDAWDDGYRRLLGLTPPDARLGCLQDIHWYSGSWGYFPTYTLGAMSAAQVFAAACAAEPEVLPGLAAGNFAPLRTWLGANVHGRGSSLSTDELMRAATGRPLDPAVFEAHLARRYLQ